jgi:hypothetical protein
MDPHLPLLPIFLHPFPSQNPGRAWLGRLHYPTTEIFLILKHLPGDPGMTGAFDPRSRNCDRVTGNSEVILN